MVFCNDIGLIKSAILNISHNPYFNRWFSAIGFKECQGKEDNSHNPYFNRWFSAIKIVDNKIIGIYESQSLF